MELSKFTANCTKSAQFAHCHCESHKIRAICVNFPRFSVPMGKIAKISGKSCFGQITQNLPAIFRFGPRKMELPKFTANCAKSAQFAHRHCKSCKIRTICTNFPRFSVPMGKIAKIRAIHTLGKLRKIRQPFSDSDPSKTLLRHMTRILQP